MERLDLKNTDPKACVQWSTKDGATHSTRSAVATKVKMKYNFELNVIEEETGEQICTVQAYSLESLEEQLRKVEHAIERHEEQNLDFANDSGLGAKIDDE